MNALGTYCDGAVTVKCTPLLVLSMVFSLSSRLGDAQKIYRIPIEKKLKTLLGFYSNRNVRRFSILYSLTT